MRQQLESMWARIWHIVGAQYVELDIISLQYYSLICSWSHFNQ